MVNVKATIFYEKSYFIGVFERVDKEEYAIARHLFGSEPSDAEVHEFILTSYLKLQFRDSKEVHIKIRRENPKKVQREVQREMKRIKETTRPSTFAQDYMREELEKHKKERKTITREKKEAFEDKKFALKQAKKKQKHRGR